MSNNEFGILPRSSLFGISGWPLRMAFCLIPAVPLAFSNRLLDVNLFHALLFNLLALLVSAIMLCSPDAPKALSIHRPTLWIGLLFPFTVAISGIVSDAWELALPDLVHYSTCFAFALLTAFLITEWGFAVVVERLSLIMVPVAAIIAAIGILQAFGVNVPGLPVLVPPGSTLASRNFAAEYAVGVLPWFGIAATFTQSRKARAALSFGCLLHLTWLFLLRGRAGYVAFVAGLAFFTVCYLRWNRRQVGYRAFRDPLLAGTGILILALILGSLPTPKMKRTSFAGTVHNLLTTDQDPEKESQFNNPRLQWAHASMEMFRSKPLLGIGTGQWAGIWPAHDAGNYSNQHDWTGAINPHNDYLEILSENGITGFLLFVLLMGLALFRLLSASQKDVRILLLATSLFAILVVSLFSFTRDRTVPQILAFLCIGVSLTVPPLHQGARTGFSTRKPMILVATILMICTGFTGIRLQSEREYIRGIRNKSAGRHEAMLESFRAINRRVYPIDVNGVPVAYFLGAAHFTFGQHREALDAFLSAKRLAPGRPDISGNIASTHYALGQKDLAIAEYENLRKAYPRYLEPQVNLLAAYANQGRRPEAFHLMNELGKKDAMDHCANKSLFFHIQQSLGGI